VTEVTVPLWTGDVSFEVAGVDLQDPSLPADLNDLVGNVIDWHGLAFGQDKALSLPIYRIVDLGRLGQGNVADGDYWSKAIALNNRGQVVGNSSTSFLDKDGYSIEHGFLWEDVNGNGQSDPGEMVDVVPGGAAFSGDAKDINESGEVLGRWGSTTTPYSEIFVRRNGVSQGSGVLRAAPGGINDGGVIVGATVISTVTGEAVRGFRQGPGGTEIFGTFGGGNTSRAEGINSLGHVVGSADFAPIGQLPRPRAFVSRDGTTLTPLPNPPNPFDGRPDLNPNFAMAINDAGWVAGYYFSIWGYRTIAWDPDGVVWDVGGSANEATYPRAINESGTIVGYADPFPNGLPNHAFMVRAGGGPIDLNTLLPPNSGWSLREANDINDRGEIVGTGIFNDWYHAYLLTTVPGPAGRRAAPAPAAAPPEPPASAPRSGSPPRRDGYAGAAAAATGHGEGVAPHPAAAAVRKDRAGVTDLLRASGRAW